MIIRKLRSINKLQMELTAAYIKQSDMDDIKQKYKQRTNFNRVKQMFQLVKLIMKQGIMDGKDDMKRFHELRQVNYDERSHEQQKEYVEIKENYKKMLPMLVIWALPMSAPLYFVYLELFPTYVPTWVLTENVYKRVLDLRTQCRRQGKDFFSKKIKQQNPQILARKITQIFVANSSTSQLNNVSNQQLRMISALLMGSYSDGTFYLTKVSPWRKKGLKYDYFLHEAFSNSLLKRKIVNFINNETTYRQQYIKKQNFFERLQFHLSINLKKLQIESKQALDK